jgi:hypothetical protein
VIQPTGERIRENKNTARRRNRFVQKILDSIF